jgi:adenylate cyclase
MAEIAQSLLGELKHALSHRNFVKSPTLSKLLAFLVFETLNGNGDKLKSYTVAVDCLGKDADFDPQTDSYPRVQTMRLRKLSEEFYAKNAPVNRLCL